MVKKLKKNVSKKVGANKKVNQNLKKNNNNKPLVFYSFGAVFILVVIALVIGFTGSSTNTTGAAITVKSYGISNELTSIRAGTIQTLIELKQPTLMNLGERGSTVASEIANKVVESANFPKEIKDSYKNNPATSIISDGALAEVKKSAKNEEENFKNDLTCLDKIGKNYRHNRDIDIILISELKYTGCNFKFSNKLFAYMKHSFFKEEDNSFLCSQESDKLFLVTKDSGVVNIDTTDC